MANLVSVTWSLRGPVLHQSLCVTLADTLWVKAVTWVSPGKCEVLPPKGVDTESNEQVCPRLLPFCLAHGSKSSMDFCLFLQFQSSVE